MAVILVFTPILTNNIIQCLETPVNNILRFIFIFNQKQDVNQVNHIKHKAFCCVKLCLHYIQENMYIINFKKTKKTTRKL